MLGEALFTRLVASIVAVLLPLAAEAAPAESSAPIADSDAPPGDPSSSGYVATVRATPMNKEGDRQSLDAKEAASVPGTYGDPVRALMSLPGISRTPFGLGPLVIRGGRQGDTASYFDDHPIPLLFHFGGLVSTIPSDAIEGMDLYLGALPSSLGRSISGAIDLRSRRPSAECFRGAVDVNLAGASFSAKGPAASRGSFLLTARRSYLDAMLPTVLSLVGPSSSPDLRLAPRYWDYLGTLQLPTDKHDFSVTVHGSDDRAVLILQNPQSYGVGQSDRVSASLNYHRVVLSMQSRLSPTLMHLASASAGMNESQWTYGDLVSYRLRSRLVSLRDQLTYRHSSALKLSTGIDAQLWSHAIAFSASPTSLHEDWPSIPSGDPTRVTGESSAVSVRAAGYVTLDWKVAKGLRLLPGLRVDSDSLIRSAWVDPRIVLLWDAGSRLTVRAGFGVAHQSPSPEKLQPGVGNPSLKEERSIHATTGLLLSPNAEHQVSLDVYYRWSTGLATRTALFDSSWLSGQSATPPIVGTGQGRAYGAELLLRRFSTGDLSGWISASLGRSEERLSSTQRWYQSTFSQRYGLTTVILLKLPFAMELGGRLRLSDGTTVPPYQMAAFDSDHQQYYPVRVVNADRMRLPLFLQIDARVTKKWTFRRWALTAYLDVQNISNRNNVEGTSYNYDYSRPLPLFGLPLFPSIGLRGEI